MVIGHRSLHRPKLSRGWDEENCVLSQEPFPTPLPTPGPGVSPRQREDPALDGHLVTRLSHRVTDTSERPRKGWEQKWGSFSAK